jgi:hypothetical protein
MTHLNRQNRIRESHHEAAHRARLAISKFAAQAGKEAQGKSRSWKDNATRWLKVANDEFGSKPLASVSASDISAAIQALLDAGNAFSAKRVRQQTARIAASLTDSENACRTPAVDRSLY